MQGAVKPLVVVDGETMLARALRYLGQLGLDDILVVLGHRAEEVEPHVSLGRVVRNPHWEEGMAASIRAGVAALPPECRAVLIMPVDLPELTDPSVGIRVMQAPGPIAAPIHQGRRGHPVRFDRALFPELLELRGDRGAAELLRRHPVSLIPVDTAGIYRDRDNLTGE